MPIYDYQCTTCGERQEKLESASSPTLQTCPTCGKETFKRLPSAPHFELKGTGWYETDFKGTKKPAEPAKES